MPHTPTCSWKLGCRADAARAANAEDATLWRWFCDLYQERRIRWCRSADGWLVSVDHRHLATDDDFDAALRLAHARHCMQKNRNSRDAPAAVDQRRARTG